MSTTDKKAFYSAALIRDDGADLGPIDVHEAQNDAQAKDLGEKRARDWLLANGVDQMILRIVNDGKGLPEIKVRR